MGFSHHEGGGDPLSCIPKLLPCQPYIKSPVTPPPSCCVPMKEMIAHESQCLCAVFSNQQMLKSFNITQQDGINLAKSCGAVADVSLCKEGAATPSGTPKAPPAPTTTSTGKFLCSYTCLSITFTF
ncbi:lipid binding protein [Dorcoceras hygrometricum]|uniref:Lipid binding protein n=1 Tax=Dorcoceras hygrometricum TaxID=472368 RepID=A0A2Z7C5C9_9LAMI|nr:lipid binding protein [Dorcoceras hygrometricum]